VVRPPLRTSLLPGFACALLLAALPASAQGPASEQLPRRGRMYLSPGLLIGSTKLVALGGAFVGIAEGPASFTSNLAAIAHRKPSLAAPWTVDLALSYLDIPLGNPESWDLDNDGLPDDARSARQLVSGVFIQIGGAGLGGYQRTSLFRYCLVPGCGPQGDVAVTLSTSAIAGALALGHDELLVALGLFATTGEIQHPTGKWSYGSFGLSFDALYRPVDRNYRVGISLKPRIVGPLTGNTAPLSATPPFEALGSPLVLSVGGSIRLGPGSERYNRLSIAKLRELGVVGEGWDTPLPWDSIAGRWLLSAQVDVIAPLAEAVPIRALLDSGAPPTIAGRTQLAPRLGVEHETLPGRLRTRMGSYLEPSPFEKRGHRLHGTGGFEVFLFRYLEDWALSVSLDVAARYSDLGVSIGFWR